jgi:AAA15 family ATPase/GTPase
MLVDFTVRNFLSFKDECTFSLLASSDKAHPNNIIKSSALKKDDALLRVGVVYGPNASGKSNLLKAMDFMRKLVVTNATRKKGDTTGVIPYKLDKVLENEPSTFNIRFVQDSILYDYGFSLTNYNIIEEHLYYYPKKLKSVIFERHGQQFHFNKKDEETQRPLADRTIENRLYMPNATDWNYEKTTSAASWFSQAFDIALDPVGASIGGINERLSDLSTREIVKQFLVKSDLGIVELEAKSREVDESDLPPAMPELMKKTLVRSSGRSEIKTYHVGVDEKGNEVRVPFDLEREESRGTLKMFELAPQWAEVLNNGSVLVVDELETSLHPHLVDYLVELFLDPSVNSSNAQLIFTTHNSNLLRLSMMRRDQIWFTEKVEGKTELYSLVELKIRKDENIEKGYLKGRYGAVPILEDIKW